MPSLYRGERALTPTTVAEARTVYRQAIERDNARRTPATRRARERAQEALAALLLRGGGSGLSP